MTNAAANVPEIALNTGAAMPQLGLGVWQASIPDAHEAVRYALAEAGYRHVDTASAYGNEEGVGRGIAESGVSRDEIFLTTKLWDADQGYDPTLAAFDASLKRLGTDYVDLYLIHWPQQDFDRTLETWRAFERIAVEGRARAIGVCNFKPHHLQRLLDRFGTVPAVNQIELHPHLPQYVTRAFDRRHGIATESWSPLGGSSNSGWGRKSKPNTLLADPVVARIGEAHGKTPAQVLIRWHLENGLIVIPKSVHAERIAANLDVLDFELTGDEFEALGRLENGERVGDDPDRH